MYMLFVDESGVTRIPRQPDPDVNYFAFGGVIINSRQWRNAMVAVETCRTRNRIRPGSELKWRHLIRAEGAFSGLSEPDRLAFYGDLFSTLASNNLAMGIVVIVDKYRSSQRPYINSPEDIYRRGFRYCLQRFLHFLADNPDGESALVVADRRQKDQDEKLQWHYNELMNPPYAWASGRAMTQLDRIVEGLMIQDSAKSLGLQVADLLVGGVLQRYKRADPRWYNLASPVLRKSPSGQVQGYGLVIAD